MTRTVRTGSAASWSTPSSKGRGVGRAALRTLAPWLAEQDDCWAIRLSYQPANTAAGRLYTSLGFVPTGAAEDDEIVVELTPRAARALR